MSEVTYRECLYMDTKNTKMSFNSKRVCMSEPSCQSVKFWPSVCALFSPVSEFRAQGEVVSKEVLLWWDGPLQPEECVMLHTGLPQVFTGSIVHHVETQQCFPGLTLFKGRRQQWVGNYHIAKTHSYSKDEWSVDYSRSFQSSGCQTAFVPSTVLSDEQPLYWHKLSCSKCFIWVLK